MQTVATCPELDDRLSAIFDEDGRGTMLRSRYACLASELALSTFMLRYVAFNGVFAGGVAALTSAIHVRDDLFSSVSTADENTVCNSAEVAAHVFHAAEDEYHVRGASRQVTHRSLALRCVHRLVSFCKISKRELPDVSRELFLLRLIAEVKENYCINLVQSELAIFRALGFHLASERCADQEFRFLDTFLRNSHSALVRKLSDYEEPWGTSAYHWIKVHCSVEEDHWRAAEKAIDLALAYYTGKHRIAKIETSIAEGYETFTGLQERFFAFASQRMPLMTKM